MNPYAELEIVKASWNGHVEFDMIKGCKKQSSIFAHDIAQYDMLANMRIQIGSNAGHYAPDKIHDIISAESLHIAMINIGEYEGTVLFDDTELHNYLLQSNGIGVNIERLKQKEKESKQKWLK